jgi:acetyltransferase-like isoleucine patch superfamily enzyme
MTAAGGLLAELLGSIGEGSEIRPPFRCDYGYQTHIGVRTFSNWGLVSLDVATVMIGDDVQMGPNVQLLTPPISLIRPCGGTDGKIMVRRSKAPNSRRFRSNRAARRGRRPARASRVW